MPRKIFETSSRYAMDAVRATTYVSDIIVDLSNIAIHHRDKLDKDSFAKLVKIISDTRIARENAENEAQKFQDACDETERQFAMARGEPFTEGLEALTRTTQQVGSDTKSGLKTVASRAGWGLSKTLGLALAIYIGTGNDPSNIPENVESWAIENQILTAEEVETLKTDPLQFAEDLYLKLSDANDELFNEVFPEPPPN